MLMFYVNKLRAAGTKMAFFSATPQGGGVALMRHALVRLSRLLSVDVKWYGKRLCCVPIALISSRTLAGNHPRLTPKRQSPSLERLFFALPKISIISCRALLVKTSMSRTQKSPPLLTGLLTMRSVTGFPMVGRCVGLNKAVLISLLYVSQFLDSLALPCVVVAQTLTLRV